MSETNKSLSYLGGGVLILLVALVTVPGRVTPDDFLDVGESFFPEFTDPNVAVSLEVVDFDEDTASARPFKVTSQGGKWTIPSHHDYPADGKELLAKTAAGIIEMRKDDFRSNNVSDHEACGVLDPLDEGEASLRGRGRRVTIKGEGDEVLADLIVGKKVEERENLRFVRLPDQKRVYVAQMPVEPSTKFEDWIEKDLLQLEKDDIVRVVLENYSINERTGSLNRRGKLVLTKKESDWTLDKLRSNEEMETYRASELMRSIDELNIVGVRPKPDGLSRTLMRTEGSSRITQADMMSLQSKGFYFTRQGSLVSNEGEMTVRTSDGVTYTLRFGEVVYGSGDAVTAGGEGSDDKESGPGENRYLFISASFNEKDVQNLPAEEEARKKQVETARERSEQLNARFAAWYYVISDDSFDRVHLSRDDLVREKTKT
jgi:hypothetical protein